MCLQSVDLLEHVFSYVLRLQQWSATGPKNCPPDHFDKFIIFMSRYWTLYMTVSSSQYISLIGKMNVVYHSRTPQWLMCPFNNTFSSLQAQAPTPPPESTWWHPPPGPTCPGRRAMMEVSHRHSQSGMAMCESSQHALLPAYFPLPILPLLFFVKNVFSGVVFRTVVKT